MISNRSDEDVGIFEGGEYCEEVRWKDLGCGIFCFYSVVSLVLFSGRSHIHEDIGCWTFMLLLFHWFCFWEESYP
jgi:hypothetical protein